MFDLNDCAAFITNKAAKILSDRLEARMAPYHVTRTQWLAMYYISKKENMTQNELADALGTKDPTVVSLIDRMERDDMLKRSPSPKDRRVRYLSLTPNGKKLCVKLTAVAEQFKDDAISGISEKDLNSFKLVVDAMISNTDRTE